MSILLTKVRPPQRRKDILRRVRLIDTIHQNLHRKLTFISAPAGYGKTTLLIDFANDVDAIVCWYLISPEDKDVVQFTRHIVAAFQQQIPHFGEELEQALNNPGVSSNPSSLAAELINEVERKVDDFCVLVLDDYHLAGENEQIVDLLENLLEHLPDQLRILMGTRSVYGIPTANLYIRDELVTISAEELRFRPDELQKLVLQNYHVRLSQEQASELAKRADGWIVAIMLAIRSMENGALPKFTGAIEQVYDYLAEEVVNRQTTDLREFMYSTSILGDFDESLCNYILERKDSDVLLRALEDRNLFITRTETSEGYSYRYHQLFSEFLEDHFRQSDAKRMYQLHSRAAEWFKKHEQWEPAIQHKLAAEEHIEAAQWIDLIASQIYATGRHSLLNQWNSLLASSEKRYRKHAPRLFLFQAKALINQGDFQRAEQLLDMTMNALKNANDAEIRANAIITRGMNQHFRGNFDKAFKLAEEGLSLLVKYKKSLAKSHQGYQAIRLMGKSVFYMGQVGKAIEYISNAARGFRKLISASSGLQKQEYSFDLSQTLTDLGFISISTGNMLEAQKAFREALDIQVKAKRNQGALAEARNNIAYLEHQTGHYKKAWNEYSLALENAQSANLYSVQIAILNGRAEILLELEEVDEAKAILQEALAIGERVNEKQTIGMTFIGLAEIERLEGNHNKAMNLLREAVSRFGNVLDPGEYKMRLGNIYMDMGQLDLAHKQFDAVLASWTDEQAPKQSQVLAAFYLFIILIEQQDIEKAKLWLEKSLKGAAQLGYDHFLVVAARSEIDNLKMVQHNNPSSQLIDLLKRAEQFKIGKSVLESKDVDIQPLSLHLEIRALGSDEVRRDGELLAASAWRSTRARALFFYITDQGKARKENVGLDFWPEFSQGKMSSNFHATLWRVRQALGLKEIIVFEDEQYSLHPSISIWYDVAEFESYIHQAIESTLPDSERAELLRQAVQLYKGDFLPDVFLDWADKRRDELQNSLLHALLTLAELEQKNKRFQAARAFYENALSIDPYRDKVHLALMDCLVSSGAPSAAKAHFQDYKATLRRELNADPLPELQSYYDKLPV